MSLRSTRRTFLGGLTAAAVGVPTLLRAQGRTVKIAMVSPVSGPMADVGQDQRLGAQLAVEAINAAGGV
ncbi:MAG TPA: ABC transporter substrate-binding protein, partial [Candidatus Dormibacteraeota bacterium]|nr:ABC transporter substrate-binding protein [Candidatus Dormibacteraeota bacterium]